jgi:hypothetical protein
LDIGIGSSASGSGGSIAISVGSGTDIGGAFSVTAGDSSGAAGGDAYIVSGSSSTSSGGSLTLAFNLPEDDANADVGTFDLHFGGDSHSEKVSTQVPDETEGNESYHLRSVVYLFVSYILYMW